MKCPLCSLTTMDEPEAPVSLCEKHGASLSAGNTLLVECKHRKPTGNILEVKQEHIYGFMTHLEGDIFEHDRIRGLVAYVDEEMYATISNDYHGYLAYLHGVPTHAH